MGHAAQFKSSRERFVFERKNTGCYKRAGFGDGLFGIRSVICLTQEIHCLAMLSCRTKEIESFGTWRSRI